MVDLRNLSIKKIKEGLLDKKFSAFELTAAVFDVIEAKNGELNAYLSLNKDRALATAAAVDAKLAGGENLDDLAGVPLAVKDNILVKGLPATSASKILENYRASYDAEVVSRLRDQNAVLIGKTNLDEFAMGSSTENSAYGVTRNPHDLNRVAGGSSGGSAAAVAGQMAVAALGSDTGGSIREPASFCGIVGLKPTYGAVSRFGLTAMASSLDQIGPLAKTAEDAAILFKAIAGKDAKDSTSVGVDYADVADDPVFEKVRGLTIGVPDEYFGDGLDQEVGKEMERAMDDLKSLKIKFKKISLPYTKYALAVYYIIMPAEVSTNLARYDGLRYSPPSEGEKHKLSDLYFQNRSQGFGEEAKRRILLGTFVLSAGYYDAYYLKAQKVRKLIKRDLEQTFQEVDVIFAPVSPTPAFKVGEKTANPLAMYLSDIFTIPANLAGIPAVSIPVRGREGKLPIGFQLMGKNWREKDVLDVGRLYERL